MEVVAMLRLLSVGVHSPDASKVDLNVKFTADPGSNPCAVM